MSGDGYVVVGVLVSRIINLHGQPLCTQHMVLTEFLVPVAVWSDLRLLMAAPAVPCCGLGSMSSIDDIMILGVEGEGVGEWRWRRRGKCEKKEREGIGSQAWQKKERERTNMCKFVRTSTLPHLCVPKKRFIIHPIHAVEGPSVVSGTPGQSPLGWVCSSVLVGSP